ncbi:MAG: bifunctional folylpolyglutamate synthase/dihydrofolate synthase [Candidatus Omnitrophica bacterium]|nr:bifunctional folylpolyglutamate synthase/dihydrofolate synthase [Candidatus Omnitrophota bacterium]
MTFSFEEYLLSFHNWEPRLNNAGASSFSLDPAEQLLAAFGRPDDKLKFLHVAGSKGKGSTCAFLASILRAAGYRVGLYTSPHIYSVRERIRVLEPGTPSGEMFEGMISEEDAADRARYYKEPVDRLRFEQKVPVTYFEYLTCLAISYFAARDVHVVILETGLGGRLDATNIFETGVCGITPIGLEHTAILGSTHAAIAQEKAGIIKSPSQRVVLAPQVAEAMAVLKARCDVFGIMPTVLGKDFSFEMTELSLSGMIFSARGRREYTGLRTGLLGAHQAENAAMAISMAESLEIFGFLLTEDAVRRGIEEARWPVRFEVVAGAPTIILDAAHTAESAQALANTFQAVFPGRTATLVIGVSQDKDIKSVCAILSGIAEYVVVTQAQHPRAFAFTGADAQEYFPSQKVVVTTDIGTAMDKARAGTKEDGIILVAGSRFVAAQARGILRSSRLE